MSGYQLYYFPIRGRGEIARWAFAVAKIDFEDVRLSGEEWAKEKECKYKNQNQFVKFHFEFFNGNIRHELSQPGKEDQPGQVGLLTAYKQVLK